MSCVRHQSSNPPRERCYYSGQHNRYAKVPYSPTIASQDAYRTGYCAGWRSLDSQSSSFEMQSSGREYCSARGDQPFTDTRMVTGRASSCRQESVRSVDPNVLEKMQTALKMLEDSNVAMQTRNQSLVEENKALLAKLDEERNEVLRLEKKMMVLRMELDREKLRLLETKEAAEQCKHAPAVEANGTSTTNIITKLDRGVQIWAVCSGCQRKLESCEKLPPTVTITKSELEELEKDMKALRDTIIAREEAWDKAMEREQNYRQQLTRFTTETITARHMADTRYEELQAVNKALSEKESELKSLQKENLYLNKLTTKLYNCQQSYKDEHQRNSFLLDEKDQRYIEDILRRSSSGKNKQKQKPRTTEKNYGNQASPRDRSARTKDQGGPLKQPKR
ncbi:uncharacterized protein LOC117225781 [Megalopta genalis]|uniref:uncharacterized protein LOC117225781 n=1 Tax=Megalopta genalis TaxID=115081 RepID=UPI003FD640AB